MMNNSSVLSFNSTVFDVVDRNGQPWLRLPQIEGALGYTSKGKGLYNIYKAHADEFTDNMTALVKLPTAGGEQDTRIFSPRGCYALGMFARTKIAKEFRVWVLDVLEGKTKTAPALDYTRISPSQAQTLKEHVNRVVASGKQTYSETWARLHRKFRVNSYLELPAAQFEEACKYLEAKNFPARYYFPLETADPHDRVFGNANLTPEALLDSKNGAPELDLIAQLEGEGYNVMGAKMRILAMREAMHYLEDTRKKMAKIYQSLGPVLEICKYGMREHGKNVQFVGKPNPNSAIDRFVFGDQM